MDSLRPAVKRLVELQTQSDKPLAIVLAGHNGSGKSTMWSEHLAGVLRIPLINADRMMMSILPEPAKRSRKLVRWAQDLRDKDKNWQLVAQQGVQGFVAQALAAKIPFAYETVFSHWREREDGTFESKIDQIRDMQNAGYFVILFFVGLTSSDLSIARVQTRIAEGGHSVDVEKLLQRFPRTQTAIQNALDVVDGAVLVDNSRSSDLAFSVCQVRANGEILFDCRQQEVAAAVTITDWLDIVAPIAES